MSALAYDVAPAVSGTSAPPIPKARAWADAYSASATSTSPPLLDLTQGVPKQPPHESFLKALSEISASAEGAKYGAILGEPSLREALAAEIRLLYQLNGGPTPSDNVSGARAGDGDAISNEHMELGTQEGGEGGGVTAEDLAITTGCNMAFLVVLMALCPPHTSSVMLPLPNYFNHAMSLSLQSVKPVYIPCDPDNSFTPSISSARKYLQSQATAPGDHSVKVRMIVLCTPSNPTGRGYSHEELKEWYHLAREYKVALVLDETYRDFVEGSDGKRGVPHGLFREKDWRSTVVSLGSFSKGYRIPGHRLGSIIASPELLKHITTICDCMQICAPRPPQLALAPLLPSLRADLDASSNALASRRKLFAEVVHAVPGWKVISSGGYYAYVQFPDDYLFASSTIGLKRKRLGSEDVAKVLAQRCGVVILPGAFFMPNLRDDEAWDAVVEGESLREDRWLRFAVANVEDEDVRKLGARLKQLNEIMGMGNEE